MARVQVTSRSVRGLELVSRQRGCHVPSCRGQLLRTALDWNFSGLTLLADSLLALRASFVNRKWLIALLGRALLFAAAAVSAFGTLPRRQFASGTLPLAAHTGTISGTAIFAPFACLTAVA